MAIFNITGFSLLINDFDTALAFGASVSPTAIQQLTIDDADGVVPVGGDATASVVVDGDDQGPIVDVLFRTLTPAVGPAVDVALIVRAIGTVVDHIVIPINVATGALAPSLGEGPFQVGDPIDPAPSLTLSSTATPPNTAPVATDDTAVVAEDGSILIDVLANDNDADGDTLTLSTVSDPTRGVAVIEGGRIRYTPDANSFGADVFTYAISDGEATATATTRVTVNAVNDAPVARPDTFDTAEDVVVSGNLFGDNGAGVDTDVEGQALTLTSVAGATSGAASLSSGAIVNFNSDGVFTYDQNGAFDALDAGQTATDSFTYDISDGAGGAATATATFTIAGVTDPVTPPSATEGPDRLTGTAGDDTINALGGDDTIDGAAGDDLLIGGGGADVIRGSGGDDRLRGNGGDDALRGNGGSDNIKGGGGSDNIKGGGGGDVIKAGGGGDTVKGGGGADDINGGGGADRLDGNGGGDVLSGRGGDDTLKGGGGRDTFQFRASDKADVVLDFRQGQDKIEILSGANSFAGLSISQDGADVLIGFGAGEVRIVTDNVGAFDESDFIF